MKNIPARYNLLLVFLHWVMALSFLLMLAGGIYMTNFEIDKSLQFKIYQWHKSLGVLLFIAFFLRLLVRVLSEKPPLPEKMKPLEQKLAKIGHYALYAFMFIIPITGWTMVSSSPYGLPTIVFGWFEWPHIPNISGNIKIENIAKTAHEILAFSFLAFIFGHILAVIKHYIFDKENLLPRMWIRKSNKTQ
jgi:cytochrome b561